MGGLYFVLLCCVGILISARKKVDANKNDCSCDSRSMSLWAFVFSNLASAEKCDEKQSNPNSQKKSIQKFGDSRYKEFEDSRKKEIFVIFFSIRTLVSFGLFFYSMEAAKSCHTYWGEENVLSTLPSGIAQRTT